MKDTIFFLILTVLYYASGIVANVVRTKRDLEAPKKNAEKKDDLVDDENATEK